MTSFYNCKHATDAYRITKFTSDLEVESSYLCTVTTCECPAGHRPKCRHREMLPKFIARGMVDSHWFFDFDRGGWVEMEQATEQEVYGEGSDTPIDVVLTPEPEPSPEPELTIAHEITLPTDASPEQVAEAFGNLLTPAGLGQASDLEANLSASNEELIAQAKPLVLPQPSPSPTIRRRV